MFTSSHIVPTASTGKTPRQKGPYAFWHARTCVGIGCKYKAMGENSRCLHLLSTERDKAIINTRQPGASPTANI